MPAKAKQMLMFFRGKRGAILLVAIGVALFFVLGGHRAVFNLALNEMAGFLLGSGDVEYQGDTEYEEVAEVPSTGDIEDTPVGQEEDHPPRTAIVTASTLLEAVRATEAMAADLDGDGIELAQAGSDTSQAGKAAGEGEPPRRTIQTYTASFLRDPFQSLISRDERAPSKLLDVSGAKMVGSVWGDSGIIALLEDEAGRSYALKVGDKVINGRVVSVTPASVTFSITVFGLTRSVTLELAEEGEW
jgi:hypothetical protein